MRTATQFSLAGMLIMLALSFSFGFHNYTETRQAIVSDLNQALQETLLAHSGEWMSQDTLKTYARLSEIFGNPVSIESHNKNFAEALHFASLKNRSGIIIRILNRAQKITASASIPARKEKTEPYLASDTVLWIAGNIPSASNGEKPIGLSFQGYADCSFATIFKLMNKLLPGVFFCLSFLLGSSYLYFFYSRQLKTVLQPTAGEQTIAYGDITLSCDQSCFYRKDKEKLKLTPQQYTLMEMFFLSPSHILTRTDICEALWPGKANADETLNTLIRRLRPLVEENTNLKITTDRGRAYILEVNEEILP